MNYWLRSVKYAAAVLAVGASFFALCAAAFALCRIWVPKRYGEYVARSAAEYGLDADFVFAIIRTESNFRADAVSGAGAVGLMQIMPSTAAFVGFFGELKDPAANIRTGCAYLAYLRDKFSDPDTLLAAYNAGEGRVRGWLADGKYSADGASLSFIPFPETKNYVRKVKKFYKCYKILYF